MDKKSMIKEVEEYLRFFGNPDKRVLKAMEIIDRKDYMPGYENFAYVNNAFPIGHSQTISQPSTVARMLSLLELKATDSVLEIGTGSGWNAALLSKLSKKVVSLELIPELAEKAKKILEKKGIKNVEIKVQNFLDIDEKFDKIIFTAGILKGQEGIIEKFAKEHLKENGILVCPYQSGPLIMLKKKKGNLIKSYTKEHYVFVPLVL